MITTSVPPTRPRLRTKTGCLTCRSRRKKCDEAQPHCSACSKLGLRCRWSQETQVDKTVNSSSPTCHEQMVEWQPHRETSHKSMLSSSISSMTASHFTSASDYELIQSWPSCYLAVSLPSAVLSSTDLAMFLAVAIQEEFVQPALAMFSGYTLYIKGDARFPTSLILENYQISVQKLLLALSPACPTPSRIALVISTTMLGMVESSGIGNPHIAVAHLTVAAQACAQFLRQRACDSAGVQVCRLAAELWLYNLPSLCVFVTANELTQLLQYLDWTMVSTLRLWNLTTAVSPHRLSPCLGVPAPILVLVLYCVNLAKQRTILSTVKSQVVKLAEMLRQIQADLDNYYRTDIDIDADTLRNHDISIVFIHAMWIYLIGINSNLDLGGTCSTKQSVNEILQILDRKREMIIETSLLWWPLSVVLCAITDDATLQAFLNRSQEFHFDGGCHRRWTLLVQRIIRRRYQDPNSTVHDWSGSLTDVPDNLDLLMTKDGIQAFCDGVTRPFESIAPTNPGPQSFWLWQREREAPTRMNDQPPVDKERYRLVGLPSPSLDIDYNECIT